MMQNEVKTQTQEKINDFVQRNRKGIFVILGIFVFMLVGSVVFFSLKDVLQKKAIADVEKLQERYVELRQDIEASVLMEELLGEPSVEIHALLEDATAFARRRSGFAGARAWSIVAHIHSSRKEWQQAEEAWRKAAKAGNRTYLGPISLFNAAAAAEEQGKFEEAIELLQKCVSHSFAFPAAPRAQFSIGRLNEQLNNSSAAIAAYRLVIDNWSSITVWANLAQSRIIVLESQ
jgi:tetratricopeptide (TPR) repeat protein